MSNTLCEFRSSPSKSTSIQVPTSTTTCFPPRQMLQSALLHQPPPSLNLIPKFQCKSFTHSPQFSPTPLFRGSLRNGYSKSFLGFHCFCSLVSVSVDDDLDDELCRLLALLPGEMRRRVSEHPELRELIEVVMDLGRKPLARFPSGDFVLSDSAITVKDIEHARSQVGDFSIDNRAGISRTLHRISAIRNRKGEIIGLTCRVGRAVSGSANMLRDLVQDGASLLLIGPPGVGKTTIIREVARMLANDFKKRVMIVDTSNEIGGDGDVPHPGIGNARRMQVPDSDMQHKVLIEAVENHMPQVIVIDEIGTKLEAMAASTIAQRGIQLVATAHGITIENLIMNPSLDMLVGGIESVTLGDEEANRRGGQKTILERKGPSTFSCAVEIVSKSELRVHRSLEATVDAILSGRLPYIEVRKRKSEGSVEAVQRASSVCNSSKEQNEDLGDASDTRDEDDIDELTSDLLSVSKDGSSVTCGPLPLYVYGILETTVIQGIRQLKMDGTIQLTDNISEADAFLALHSKLKKNPRIQAAVKSHGIPIYVTKTSSLVQITKAIRAMVNDHTDGMESQTEDEIKASERIDALEEARIAIEEEVIPKEKAVELLPRSPYIISLQLDFIQKYQLEVEKLGKEPNIRLRILPYEAKLCVDTTEASDADNGRDDFTQADGHMNGSAYSIEKLPLLPD